MTTRPTLPQASILISTRNRRDQIEAVLKQLDIAAAEAGAFVEIIVVDNGSSDSTATFLDSWQRPDAGRVALMVPQPGKSRALNQAQRLANAPLLLFTDDDVVVPSNWITATLAFFREHPEYAAAMGPVRVPPDEASAEIMHLVTLYPGIIPLFEIRPGRVDLDEMYGCNMAVRREAFIAMGGFNEQLGPGANGYCDDTDLSFRLRRAGMRLGYMRDAVMFHTIDRARLTLPAFREYHKRCAYGHYMMEPAHGWAHHAVRFIDAAIARILWRLRHNETKRLQAFGRMIRHREQVRLRWAKRGSAS